MICEKILECFSDPQLNCSLKSDCKQSSRSHFVCEDKGSKSKYRLTNDTGADVVRYHVDGGIYHREENLDKCDFLFVVNSSINKFVFVELKGRDIEHGMIQLTETIKKLRNQMRKGMFYARLVYTGSSSVRAMESTPSILNALKELKRTLKIRKDGDIRFKRKTLEMTEKISEL